MSARRARFITVEGIDGAGKSTHLEWLAAQLRALGHSLLVSREPGGTELGERLRELVLHADMDVETETLIMFAARREHMARVILPALAAGQWVLCDRFSDASFAYQGGGKGVAHDKLSTLERWVQGDFGPDLTLLFDIPTEQARSRLAAARSPDRFEREGQAFFERVRDAYLKRAAAQPERFVVIDASRGIEAIQEQIGDEIRQRFTPDV